MDTDLREQLLEQVTVLPPRLQWRVLEYARSLATPLPKGTPGRDLEKFAGTISHEDAAEMMAAIEEACETIDEDSW